MVMIKDLIKMYFIKNHKRFDLSFSTQCSSKTLMQTIDILRPCHKAKFLFLDSFQALAKKLCSAGGAEGGTILGKTLAPASGFGTARYGPVGGRGVDLGEVRGE